MYLQRTDGLPLDPAAVEAYSQKRKERDESNWTLVLPPPKLQKPNASQPANHEVTGFMSLRGEFDEEFENEAETHVGALVFNDDDAPDEVMLKLKMLDIYNTRLERRYERRGLIISRGLVNYSKLKQEEKQRTKEEKDLVNTNKPFARIQSAEDYRLYIEGLLSTW